MRIGCPSCHAEYVVPDDRLASGRVVRCARCGTDWTPVVAAEPARPVVVPVEIPPPLAPSVPDPPPVPAPFPVASPAERSPPARRRGAGVAIGWLLSVAALAALGWAAYAWRADVMRVWPASERAYVALGLAPVR